MSSHTAPLRSSSHASVVRAERVATSEAQRELWTAAQLGVDASLAFNEAVEIPLVGALDRDALSAAVATVVSRHEALRSCVSTDGKWLDIGSTGADVLEVIDLTSSATDEQARAVADHRRRMVDTPFDLEQGPLFYATLFSLAPTSHILMLAAHHIVCDGWSFGVIARELGLAYSAVVRGIAPRFAPADRVSAYAAALAAEAEEPEALAAEAYWVEQFKHEVMPLELPADHARPPQRRFNAGRVDVALPRDVVDALRAQAAAQGTTLFVTLLSGFSVLLHRLSGQEDIMIGIPAAGQARLGLTSLVGHCVNLLPLRTQPHAEHTFDGLRRDVQRTLFDALDHQQMTYGALLKQLPLRRDPSRLPLVSVVFNLDRGLGDAELGFEGLTASLHAVPRSHENFELFLNAVELNGDVVLELQYSAVLFEAVTMQRWLANYAELLAGAARAPECTLARLPMLTTADREQIVAWQSGPQLDLEHTALVPGRIAHMAQLQPDAVAVSDGTHSLTYATLDARANQLARALRLRGVRRDMLVGVLVPRDARLPEAFLGVLRAGGAYVPLDPELPEARLHFVVQDSGLTHVVVTAATRELLPRDVACEILDLDADERVVRAMEMQPLAVSHDDATPESTAFVIYTSGSTGTPKGSRNTHRGLRNFVVSNDDGSGPMRGGVSLALAAVSFDASVGEMAMALCNGARLVVVPREIGTDGARLSALMDREDVTYMFATPSSFRLLIEAGWQGSPRLTVTCGGEAMTADLATALSLRTKSVWNIYGPSETSIWVTRAAMSPVPARVTIGRPMLNTRVEVLDALGEPAPIGVAGDVWIAGPNVGAGYIGRDDLTAHTFHPDPQSASASGLRYRTGDNARWTWDGALEFLGRNDDQVKLRGFRIELGEIAARLNELPSVALAVVVVREDHVGDPRLVAYVKPAAPHQLDVAAMRQHVATSLPSYMVPQVFVALDAFPLLPSGKINRRALPTPADQSAETSRVFRAPTTDMEKHIAAAWARGLRVARVSTDDDFFALGGHSLLASQVLADLRQRHGLEVPYRLFFEAPTVVQLAAAIEARLADATPVLAAKPIRPRDRQDRAPASLMQRRLWMLEALDPANRMVLVHGAAWRLYGALDANALEGSLQDVIARHATLRTRFVMENGVLYQVVEPTVPFALHRFSVEDLPATERDAAMVRELESVRAVPFEMDRPPLFRAMLVRFSATEHVLLTLQHGLVWDGWSFDVFLDDLTAAYSARRHGHAPSWEPLTVSYGDFSEWQADHLSSPVMEPQIAWWREHLAGELPVLELPTDFPRPDHASFVGGRVQLRLSADEADQLRRAAQREGATLFQYLFAAFHVLLHRYSGQHDLLVGMPLRNRSCSEVAGLIGPFTNTVTVRSHVEPTDTFSALLRRLKQDCVQVLEHQEMPFEMLDRRAPVVRALFSMQDARARPQSLDGVELAQFALDEHTATNDLMLWTMEYPSSLLVVLSYRSDLFREQTAITMVEQFRSIAHEASASPSRPIGRFALTTPALSASIHDGNAGPRSGTARWAEQMTTSALAPLAAQYLSAWHACGVSAGRVIVLRTRDERAAVAMQLAACIDGVALVRLAADESDEYVRAVAHAPRDSASPVALVVTDAVCADLRVTHHTVRSLLALSASALPSLVPHDESPAEVVPVAGLVVSTVDGPQIHLVDADVVASLVDGLRHALALRADDVVCDFGVLDDGPPIAALAIAASAAQRIAVEDALALEGEEIVDALRDAGATVMMAGDSVLRELHRMGWDGDAMLRVVVVGPCDSIVLSWLQSRVADVLQGYLVAGYPGVVAVGPAADRTAVHVFPALDAQVDEGDSAAPLGVPGRLSFRGLALGQPRVKSAVHARRQLDAHGTPVVTWGHDALVARPSLASESVWLGTSFVSRAVIDARVAVAAQAADAVVALQSDGVNAPRLVAYLVGRGNATDAEVRRALRSSLPLRAIPTMFVALDALPRSEDGRVDSARLPNPLQRDAGASRRLEPQSADELLVAALWCDMLELPSVKLTDNFFTRGGYSLLAFQMIDRIAQSTGHRLNPRVLLFGTLEHTAAELTAMRASA
ncbi:MAG: amino acid adenylation domain-containing protein [Gemmatimonadaceae bacterium]|nr:amino acid adenylation domain-containing protein [Gemmatimonadaceae bacterium]